MMFDLHAIDDKKSRISELPYDIVVSIISYLTIKEAIATSVLSRGWKHMWKYTTGSWRFNLSEVCEKYGGHEYHEYRKWIEKTGEDYVTRDNQALESHRGPFLYELGFCIHKTYFPLPTGAVFNWISMASRKCVRRLELNSDGVNLNKIVPTLPVFSQVTHLTLESVRFTEETLCYFLSRCLLLEHLCVIECLELEKLKVGGDSLLKLKHLEISDSYCLKSLEISAPNLVSFVCRGLHTNALFKDVPLLSTLSIGVCTAQNGCRNLAIIEPLSYVSQIESLTLDLDYLDNLLFRSGLIPDVELSNLKHLELRISHPVKLSFLPYTWLLKASPLLSSLKIDLEMFSLFEEGRKKLIVYGNWRKHELFGKEECLTHNQATIYRHQCLRVVTLSGFLGYQRDTEFVLHLIGMATSLKKMVIDCSQEEIPTLTPESWRKERSIARQIAEELRSKLPPATEFVVL